MSCVFGRRLFLIVGLLQCCVCLRLFSRDFIRVPINYQDTDSTRYNIEETEYDIVDQNLRITSEDDYLTLPKVTQGPGREELNPSFTTISSRTVIPDQSELDKVDEKALQRGHEVITVDKDNELLTEVIEDDLPPSSLPLAEEPIKPSQNTQARYPSEHMENELKAKTGNVVNNSQNEKTPTTFTEVNGQNVIDPSPSVLPLTTEQSKPSQITQARYPSEANKLKDKTGNVVNNSQSERPSTTFSEVEANGQNLVTDPSLLRLTAEPTSSSTSASNNSKLILSKSFQNTHPNKYKEKKLKHSTGNSVNNSQNDEKPPTTFADAEAMGQKIVDSSTKIDNELHPNSSLKAVHDDSSLNSQTDLNKSFPSDLRKTNNVDVVAQNSSRNFLKSSHNDITTLKTQLIGLDTHNIQAFLNLNKLKLSSASLQDSLAVQNSTTLIQDGLKPKPTKSVHSLLTTNSSVSLGEKPVGNTVLKNNASNLQTNNKESLKPKSSKTIDTRIDSIGVVDVTKNDILPKDRDNGKNISKKKYSQHKNNADVMSIIEPEAGHNTIKKLSSNYVKTVGKNTASNGPFNTSGNKSLASTTKLGRNNTLPKLSGVFSKRKKYTMHKVDKKLNVLVSPDNKKGRSVDVKEVQKMKSLGAKVSENDRDLLSHLIANYDTRNLLPKNFRRTNIIHHSTSTEDSERTPHTQSKASRKLQSFLSAVKQMFKEPETADGIMAWEAWGPCSRTCGVGAVRTRERKCGRLVQSDFDVACPEPVQQSQKCSVVPCLAKSKPKTLPESTNETQTESTTPHQTLSDNDQKNLNQMSAEHPDEPRVQAASSAVDKVTGTEKEEGTIDKSISDTVRFNTEDQTEDDGSSAEDNEGTTVGYDGTLDEESSKTGFETGNRKRYVYTVWGSWSRCSRTCGQRAYAFRKRYCINAVSGEVKGHCQRPTILAKKCALKPCPVDGGLSNWSKWSSCSDTCGIMERHRSCTNPKPALGGKECFKLPVQMRLCGICTEDKVKAVRNLASYSPKVLCGFDPCQRVGCLENKGAICVTDFECSPTFFDEQGSVLKGCKDSTQLFLRPLAQKKCSFNPCSFTKCDVKGAKCLVDTKCRPFFVDDMAKRVNCKGSNVLQISSELICGFNPCKITTCTVDPEAKCVTDYRCSPLFINAAGQRISGCTDDEVIEAERLATERPERPLVAQQTTENPSARDKTPKPHFNPNIQHNLQKYREEKSVKKNVQGRIHKNSNQPQDVKLIEDSDTEDSENSMNSEEDATDKSLDMTSFKNLGNAKASDIKLLERILKHRLDRFHKNPMVSEKIRKFQDKTKDRFQKDSQKNFDDSFDLSSQMERPHKGVTLKTVHKSGDETTEIYDNPLSANETSSEKIKNVANIQEIVDRPLAVASNNSLGPTDKLEKTEPNDQMTLATPSAIDSETSRQEQGKDLADVDKYIMDEFYRKKQMENAGSPSLGSSGVDQDQDVPFK